VVDISGSAVQKAGATHQAEGDRLVADTRSDRLLLQTPFCKLSFWAAFYSIEAGSSSQLPYKSNTPCYNHPAV